ncbi:uncharacterized protein AMSG_05571 [Thecamonas trahens ATCC 50062]|uniref:Uncharacterized protein n=1 Tax=Thecamonas trahens ATCC 50062 TaxID=461836 RepID=A0A0L0DB35_THETB|nr:hypothetical protein AMSG_05571 [Thecamonas trahens ATCC 50062]KNC49542.1 hypothetical protein AMSG_05571 [Thecamonas trahens ATCC 50062]|eukprot:XP_013757654.1 hypothetical protein AMSG_05571 [Thecamonas trahens ATCC 50062]
MYGSRYDGGGFGGSGASGAAYTYTYSDEGEGGAGDVSYSYSYSYVETVDDEGSYYTEAEGLDPERDLQRLALDDLYAQLEEAVVETPNYLLALAVVRALALVDASDAYGAAAFMALAEDGSRQVVSGLARMTGLETPVVRDRALIAARAASSSEASSAGGGPVAAASTARERFPPLVHPENKQVGARSRNG